MVFARPYCFNDAEGRLGVKKPFRFPLPCADGAPDAEARLPHDESGSLFKLLVSRAVKPDCGRSRNLNLAQSTVFFAKRGQAFLSTRPDASWKSRVGPEAERRERRNRLFRHESDGRQS